MHSHLSFAAVALAAARFAAAASEGAKADLNGPNNEGGFEAQAEVTGPKEITLTQFTLRAPGPDLFMYGSPTDNIADDGFKLNDDQITGTFDDETLTVKIDDNISLDDVEWISLWCVSQGIDFGSARLTGGSGNSSSTNGTSSDDDDKDDEDDEDSNSSSSSSSNSENGSASFGVSVGAAVLAAAVVAAFI